MNLPKSAGEPPNLVAPRSARPRLDLGIDEGSINLVIELVDDLGGRIFGRANTYPVASLVPRHELADGRDVRQFVRTPRRRYGKRAIIRRIGWMRWSGPCPISW